MLHLLWMSIKSVHDILGDELQFLVRGQALMRFEYTPAQQLKSHYW